MASPSLSVRWWLALAAIIVGTTGCPGGGTTPPPPGKELPDAARSKVEVNRAASVLANGKDAVTITVTVLKEDGAALSGSTVNLEVSGEGNTLSAASGKTDGQGVMTATLVSTSAGSKRVTASVEAEGGAVVLSTRPTVEFQAPVVTKLAFAATTLQGTAGAPLGPVVEVVLQDGDGNKVTGSTGAVTLELATGPASAQLEGTLTATAVDGVARFSEVVLKLAGTGYSLRARSGTLTEAISPPFEVLAAQASLLELTGLPASLTAGSSASLQVKVKDGFANAVTHFRGTLHFSSTDAAAVLPADFTFTAAEAGQKSFTGLVLSTAGSQRITVGATVPAVLNASADVQVVAGAASKLVFKQQPGNHSVRASLGAVQVALADSFGNLTALAAPSVSVALTPVSAGLSGTLTVAPVDGVASFGNLSVAQEGSGYTLTASAAGLTAATSAAFTIVDDVAPAQPVLTPGATTTTTIAVQWVAVGDDGTLGTATSQELRYSTSDIVSAADFAAATLVATSAPKAAGAAESANITGLSASTNYYVALKVTDNAGNSVRSATRPVSTSNPAITQLAFTTQPANGTAGTALATVRVALQDATGTVVSSATSAVTLNLLNGPVFTPVTANAVAGVATFTTLRIDTAGTGYQFEASVGALPAKQSTPFAVSPGAAASLDMTGLAAQVASGASGSVQVTARDAFGNLATGYTGTVHFTSSDAAATLPANAAFTAGDAGQKSFSGVVLKTSGSQTVTVTDTVSATLTRSLTVNVVGGAASQLVLSVPASPVTAGGAFPVTVTLKDSAGNVATSYTGTVHFTSSDTAAVLPGDYTFTAGDAGVKTFATVQLRTSGARSLTATDTAIATLTSTQSLTVNSAAAASLKLTAPAAATAGSSFNVTVTARDAFNNVATGYTGTVQLTSTDARATLPASYTFTAADVGSRLVSVTLGTSGTQPLSVTDGTRSDSASLTVSPGAAASLSLTGLPATVTAGVPTTVTVTVRDALTNVATGYTGTVHFTSTDSGAPLPADYTFTAGDAGVKTFSVQLRTSGARSLTAADTVIGSLTSTQSTTVSPGAAAVMQMSAPATATAGAAFNVTVTLRDAFLNVATGYTGTAQFSSTDAQATLPSNYTFTAGDAGSHVFSVTLATSGGKTINVTDGTRNASASVTVAPGAATSLSLTGLPASVIAGEQKSVTVTARDAYNNVATGYTGTVHFTSTDAAATLPGDYSFISADAGTVIFQVELHTAGARTVSLTGTGVAGTVTASTTVAAAAADHLVFTAQPGNGTVRAALSSVKVALRDPYDNAVPASSPTVTLGLSGGNVFATLGGTTNVDPVSGVSTFADLTVDEEGTGYQLVAIASGLTGDTSTVFNIVDNLAPAAAVISATMASSSSATISWVAVGDDGTLGTAASYDLRYASTPITTPAAFAAATPFAIAAPQAAGSAESVLVTGLNLSGDVYFALKVIDGVGNSSLSNSPKVAGDVCAGVTCTPPATACSANGRTVVSYTSACVDSGGVGVCQNTPTVVTTCQSFETCSSAACVPVTAAAQQGSVIISEFSALGAEFVELRNTTAAAIDIHGFTLRNAAGQEVDLRAITDPNGTAGTPINLAASGVLYGIANPTGAIPGGTGFVYGAPGTTFALADTGDALALYGASSGSLRDVVDFRSFKTNPDLPLVAANFVGFAGSSTQLEPTTSTAAGNDTATNWCVSFYGNGVRGSRIANTAGALNGSCKVAVINEALIDAVGTDDTKSFVEIAGPGGSVIGGAKITDVEGTTAPTGVLNTDGDLAAGETDGEFVIPAGTRIPADGILLIADANNAVTATTVPGFITGVDVLARDMDMENGPDALQLVSATGTLLDTLGHDTTGVNWTNNTAYNGLAMYETGTALTPTSPAGTVAPTLARSPLSADTDNNRNDFRADPTPTPGAPNDAINLTITSLTPDDALATAGVAGIAVVGTDFSPGMRVVFGSNGSSPCTINSATSATCTAVSNAGGVVARVNVTFQNPTSVGAPDTVLTGGFTYTGNENETNNALEADYCDLRPPASFTVVKSTATPFIYGRIYEAGVTDGAGAPAGVLAEVGYGTLNSDPRTSNSWRFFSSTYNTQYGNDDEFMGSFIAPATAANYSYTTRFSMDNGVKWTYCDINGAGSGSLPPPASTPHTFEPTTQLGVMTVQ